MTAPVAPAGAWGAVPCGCATVCGDLPEDQCHPRAVCKGLPAQPLPPLVEAVMVPREAVQR